MKVFFIVLSFALQAFSSYGLERISQQRDGGLNFYLSDGQGSIRMLTDESGEVTDEYGFTAFGEELYKSGTTALSNRPLIETR